MTIDRNETKEIIPKIIRTNKGIFFLLELTSLDIIFLCS